MSNLVIPNVIRGFDRISEDKYDLTMTLKDLAKKLDNVTSGSLEEVVLSYDNRIEHFSLRIRGRGDDIHFEGDHYKLIYDEVGPVAGYELGNKLLESTTIADSITEFLIWMGTTIEKQ